MQSSGVGNCINMFSMIQECRFPLLAIVDDARAMGEANPWQVPRVGRHRPPSKAWAFIVHNVDEAQRVPETVAAAARLAFSPLAPSPS